MNKNVTHTDGLPWTYKFEWQMRANTYTSVYLLTVQRHTFSISSHFRLTSLWFGYLHTEMTKLLLLFLTMFVSTIVITDQSYHWQHNLESKAINNQLTEEVGVANNMHIPSGKINSFFKWVWKSCYCIFFKPNNLNFNTSWKVRLIFKSF